MTRKTFIVTFAALFTLFLFAASGCSEKTPPEPKNLRERIQAIDSDPKFTPEQKDRYKQQAAESEKAAAMGRQMFGDAKPSQGGGAKAP